jgi:hypothetical protein
VLSTNTERIQIPTTVKKRRVSSASIHLECTLIDQPAAKFEPLVTAVVAHNWSACYYALLNQDQFLEIQAAQTEIVSTNIEDFAIKVKRSDAGLKKENLANFSKMLGVPGALVLKSKSSKAFEIYSRKYGAGELVKFVLLNKRIVYIALWEKLLDAN